MWTCNNLILTLRNSWLLSLMCLLWRQLLTPAILCFSLIEASLTSGARRGTNRHTLKWESLHWLLFQLCTKLRGHELLWRNTDKRPFLLSWHQLPPQVLPPSLALDLIFLFVNEGHRPDDFCNTYHSKLALEFKTDPRSKVICWVNTAGFLSTFIGE